MEQGSDQWFAARAGKVTASRVADVVAKTKSGWGASRANYMSELICERLTGEKTNGYTNAAMQWGIETEPQARNAYEFFTDNAVTLVGFVDHPTIEMAGASPDGLVSDGAFDPEAGYVFADNPCGGLVEIKCPSTSTHIDTLLSEKVPLKYMTQMQWQMACTQTRWGDFVSYDPRLPVNMQLWVSRIERDDERIKELEEMVAAFLDELDAKVKQLQERRAA